MADSLPGSGVNKREIMVLAECRRGKIHGITFELLAWGRLLAEKLDGEVSCCVLGTIDAELTQLIHYGADRVYAVNGIKQPEPVASSLSAQLLHVIRTYQPQIVIAAATTYGRTLMPLTAARLNTGLTADCTQLDIDPVDGTLLQTRPAIGGNIMATIKTPSHRPQMATVRPKTIRPLPPDSGRRGEIFQLQYLPQLDWTEKLLSFQYDKTQEVNLQDAEIVITGGKGLESKENFRLVEELAALLGAAYGASRDAVEAGWAPYSHQIGLTGKTVAPRVYLAAGVAGKIQHLAGMITSEYIIAINSDPEAPIFQVADLAIIGDAPTVLRRLIAAFKKSL